MVIFNGDLLHLYSALADQAMHNRGVCLRQGMYYQSHLVFLCIFAISGESDCPCIVSYIHCITYTNTWDTKLCLHIVYTYTFCSFLGSLHCKLGGFVHIDM